MYPELLISAIALMISALSALATLYLAQQLSILRKTYLREAKASQMERTLRAVQLPPEISATIDSFLHRSLGGEKIGVGRLSFDDYRTSLEVTHALEFLETLATGILSGVYDESIAYSRLGDRIVYFYEETKSFIYESQSQSLASLYVQLTQLARHWQSRTQRVKYRL